MNTQKVVVNNPQPPPPIQHETTRPGSTTSMGSRHESELMEQLRKVEESAAKDKWRNIVQFCKEVCIYTQSKYSYHFPCTARASV